MTDPISIHIPYERGMQLRDLALAHGLSTTDAIGLLLDHAARTGLALSVAESIPAGMAQSVEDLLGDLELGEEEGADEVFEHIGELDVAD